MTDADFDATPDTTDVGTTTYQTSATTAGSSTSTGADAGAVDSDVSSDGWDGETTDPTDSWQQEAWDPEPSSPADDEPVATAEGSDGAVVQESPAPGLIEREVCDETDAPAGADGVAEVRTDDIRDHAASRAVGDDADRREETREDVADRDVREDGVRAGEVHDDQVVTESRREEAREDVADRDVRDDGVRQVEARDQEAAPQLRPTDDARADADLPTDQPDPLREQARADTGQEAPTQASDPQELEQVEAARSEQPQLPGRPETQQPELQRDDARVEAQTTTDVENAALSTQDAPRDDRAYLPEHQPPAPAPQPSADPTPPAPPPADEYEEPSQDEPEPEPATLSQFERIDQHSDGRLNKQFMDQSREHIAQTPDHPLRGLLTEDGNWRARSHLSQEPTVQAGHLVSRHAGFEERFALEDSYFNQQTNWVAESKDAVVVKSAVEIGRVPVELNTAQMWARTGLLDPAVLAQAPPHTGWTRR